MVHQRWTRCVGLLALAGHTALTGACTGILEVANPRDVDASVFEDPKLAEMIRVSTVGEFQCAFSNYAFVSAMWTGEVSRAIDNLTYAQWSQRQIVPENTTLIGNCPSMWGTFRVLQTARVMGEDAMRRYQEWDLPTKDAMTAHVATYAGFATQLLGESYCELTFDGGPLETPTQAFARAEAHFTTGIAAATAANDQPTLNLARLGRARARLNQGRGAEAVADAELIPANFVAYSEGGSSGATSRSNWFWNTINNLSNVTVPASYRGLTVDGTNDTRVQNANSGRLSINNVPIWNQLKYLARISDIPLAKWEEAQLIIAEVRGGQEAVAAINRVRARFALPAFASTSDAEIRTQMIEERRRTLWLEGKTLGDMRRLCVAFPQGTDYQGSPINTQTCMPLPMVERVGNPNVA